MNVAKRMLCVAALGLSMAFGAGGSVAQAVSVTPLPDAARTLSATNPALAQQLNNWRDCYNRALASLEPLALDKAIDSVLGENSLLQELQNAEAYTALNTALEPLLERWQGAAFARKEVNADDATVLRILKEYGLTPQSAEGMPYLNIEAQTLLQHIQADGLPAFLAVYTKQPAVLFSDGGCVYSVPEMGDFAVAWEKYMRAQPQSPLYSTAREQYISFMDFLMFSILDNTPAFPRGKMRKEWFDELQAVVRAHPQTTTADVLQQFLKDTKAANYTFSKKRQTATMQRIDQAFPAH